MPYRPGLSSLPLVLGFTLAATGACAVREPPQETYFDRSIAPILTGSCARSATLGTPNWACCSMPTRRSARPARRRC